MVNKLKIKKSELIKIKMTYHLVPVLFNVLQKSPKNMEFSNKQTKSFYKYV